MYYYYYLPVFYDTTDTTYDPNNIGKVRIFIAGNRFFYFNIRKIERVFFGLGLSYANPVINSSKRVKIY